MNKPKYWTRLVPGALYSFQQCLTLKTLHRLSSGLLVLAVAALILAQQHRVNILKQNESSLKRILVKYRLENSALRLKLAGRLE